MSKARKHPLSSRPQRQALRASLLLAFALASSATHSSEFRDWQRQEREAYNRFMDERDKEFLGFLRDQWREFETFRGLKRDATPKPKVMPQARPDVKIKPVPEALPAPPPVAPVAPPQPTIATPLPAPPSTPIAPPPAPAVRTGETATVPFYGHTLTIGYDKSIAQPLRGAPTSEAISNYWQRLATSKHEALLAELQALQQSLKLNDWACADLVRRFVGQVHPNEQNNARLLAWFLLTKLGYEARVGYDDRHIHLFVSSNQKIYETKYLVIQGKPYYAVLADDGGSSIGKVFTYQQDYPGRHRPIDLRMAGLQLTKPVIEHRELQFEYGGKRHSLNIPYDRKAVEFLGSYPQTDLDWYFAARANDATSAALVREMRSITAGMNEGEALNLLLRFVQTAFAYKTDDQQFGAENYLFVDETLFYPYSDCEDRSVLFAWLAREVLGVEVIGLSYPGHVATAVLAQAVPKGAAIIEHEGKTYVVADPTYIGAGLGMSMPAYANVRAQVIAVR